MPAALRFACILLLTTGPALLAAKPKAVAPPADPARPLVVADDAAFFGALDLTRPELAAVRRAVQSRNWPAARAAWSQHLATRTTPHWLWSRRDKAALLKLCGDQPNGTAPWVAEANLVLERRFSFSGVDHQFQGAIDWGQFRNEWTHQLSRFDYWRTLGKAWWVTGDARYAKDFVAILMDWVARNPVPDNTEPSWRASGTVWRTLECGIRALSWLDAMEYFQDAPEFTPDAKFTMTRSLLEHARRLHRHNDRFRQGNWQVCETTGLFALGTMFPEFKESASWRDTALRLLVEHMQKDVYPDGMHWETSPGYHTWVMKEFLETALLARTNGIPTPGLLDRHELMFDALLHLAKPDRRYPPLGDAGTGTKTIEDAMGLGALLYQRGDMRSLAPDRIEADWVWLFGPKVAEDYARTKSTPANPASHRMSHVNYMVMRTGWTKSDKYLLFDGAPWGGGHCHQDRLQVVVWAGGRDLLVDPGMYSYDQPLSRTYLRKSEAHNVLTVDGREQPASDPAVLAWHTSPAADFASAEIHDKAFKHQRSVLFVRPDYWVVLDHVSGEGEHDIARQFHFPLGPVVTNATSAATQFPEGMNVSVHTTDGATVSLRDGWIPTGSATAATNQVGVFTSRVKLPASFVTVITPVASGSAAPVVESLANPNALQRSVRVRFADGAVDHIVVSPESAPLRLNGRTSSGHAVIDRTRSGKTVTTVVP
jgi:hypothetical protein